MTGPYNPFAPLPPMFQGTTPQGGDESETRLSQLAKKFPPQWGDSKEMDFATSELVGSNLVRWQGEDTDVRVWRVYLSPWMPKADITNVFPASGTSYVQPVLWGSQQPGVYDSMGISNGRMFLYGRITFGTGGQRHVAYCDWPRRGLLLQVGGSYVQLDAIQFSSSINPPGIALNRLPIISATLAPEPGGGDSASPATYTYPINLNSEVDTQIFQIPPFARTFTPLFDRATLTGVVVLSVRSAPGGALIDSWTFDATTPPVGGPVELQLPIPQDSGVVEITMLDASDLQAGCMFHLDL